MCDGTGNTAVTCQVSMSYFTSTLSLTYNTVIEATVAAINAVGTGTTSPYSTTSATAATVPPAPTTLV